jgi:hypothetical protein
MVTSQLVHFSTMTPTTIAASTRKPRKVIRVIALAGGVALLSGVVLLCARWPFREQAVLQDLQRASMCKVQIGSFHGRYFPRPGCVLEHVTFQHNPQPGTAPLITAQRITIQGSFLGLFARRVSSVRVEMLHIFVPPPGTDEKFQVPSRSAIVIDDLIADGAILEIAARTSDKPPLRFAFREFALGDVGSSGPASFRAKLSNPEPPGEIATNGHFGPWNDKDVGKTPVSGEYLFQQADLGVFAGIAGTLSSSGKFSGTIEHISAEGNSDTPNFTVTSSSHKTALQTHFQAEVDGENGDTFLQNVTSHFWRTTVSSNGSVAGTETGQGKTTSINLATQSGRIEDLLGLFTSSKRAPMSGIVNFNAKVTIPPDGGSFLQKVELQGDFGVDDGKFRSSDTQEGVNNLSEGASGEKLQGKNDSNAADDGAVVSDLTGHVVLKSGTAHFSHLSFRIPGAAAEFHGTYNLINANIDLHGTLTTRSELYKTTTGVKAWMLKALDPFLKKHPAGYTAPVKITGTYDHPSFGLDLFDSNDKREAAKNGGSRK